MLKVAINGFEKTVRQVIKIKLKQIEIEHKRLFLFILAYTLILLTANLVSLIYLIHNPSEGISLLGNFFTSFSIASLSCFLFSNCRTNFMVIFFNLYLAVFSYYLVFFNKLRFKHWILVFIFVSLVTISFLSIRNY